MNIYLFKSFYALTMLLLLTSGSTLEFKYTTAKSEKSKCIEREKQALLKFKQTILVDHYMLSTWRDNEKDEDCCKWKGIECNNETGHVKKLDLKGDETQYLVGSKNFTSLIALQNLEYLDLSHNYFPGIHVLEYMSSLTKLRYLNLSNSAFGGSISYQIGNLLELEYLDLSMNNFDVNVEIPSNLGNLTCLRYLNLGDNENIVGEIPYQLRNLSLLEYLDLEGTSLLGPIPFHVGNFPVLKTLKLDGDFYFTYNATKWLSTISSLKNLVLRGKFLRFGSSHHLLQTIKKTIPKLRELRLVGFGLVDNDVATLFSSHSNFSISLTILDFSNNMLTSPTFQFLSNISLNLQELYLSQNNIVLSSHQYPMYYPSLIILDLSYNSLASIQFLRNLNFIFKLQELYLTDCGLTDKSFLESSTSTLNSSSSLLVLDLSSNLLRSSKVFFWIFNFITNLHSLALNGNLLEGRILDGFGKSMNSIEHIDFSDNHLQGEIPSFFGSMCTLQTLDLSNNNFSGEVSNFIQNSSRCNKHILWRLDLSYNQISGVLPKSTSLLSNLEHLNLVGNSLEGEINESHLINSSKLKTLSLSYNSLSLKFSRSWIPPFQLTSLKLASCKLGSSFPSWLQTQKSIMRIDISDAGIDDHVPEWIWKNSQHILLMNISHNNLKGTIPDFAFKFSQNPAIILNSNQFEGGVPSFFLQASHLMLFENKFSNLFSFLCEKNPPRASLATLDLSNNQITGQLPDCWKSVSKLLFLDLTNNKISGNIPKSMGTLVKLEALVLRNNSLNGELPSTLKNCSNLMLLDVDKNVLSSRIPSWIGESMKQLIILSMTQNRFYGRIPNQLCYLRKIQLLDLSRNNLSEGLPTCLENLTALSEKNVNTNETESQIYSTTKDYFYFVGIRFDNYAFNITFFWKGMERGFNHPEMRVKSIDLSSNRLIGEIPKKIGHLVGLVSLNLSRNHLSGEIPFEIGNLVSLDFLDLSRNHLSGKIPPTFSNIDRLEVLDLSNNFLYGRIPFGRQLQTLDPSGFEGNPNLCGEPLGKICPGDIATMNPKGPEIHGEDDNSIFHEGFYMSMGLGYFMGFWSLLGPILLWRPWRITYLRFLNKLTNYMHILVAINMTKFQIWLKN